VSSWPALARPSDRYLLTMKIVILGGSGQVGTILARAFHKTGHEVVALSRKPGNSIWRSVRWDAETLGDWAAELDGADALINLAGRSVNCRYTPENRRLILESRVKSNRLWAGLLPKHLGHREFGFRPAPPRSMPMATMRPMTM